MQVMLFALLVLVGKAVCQLSRNQWGWVAEGNWQLVKGRTQWGSERVGWGLLIKVKNVTHSGSKGKQHCGPGSGQGKEVDSGARAETIGGCGSGGGGSDVCMMYWDSVCFVLLD